MESNKKLIYLFCSGYPSSENQTRGIFTHRTAKILANEYLIKVIVFSSWKPFKDIKYKYNYDGIEVIKLSILQLPHLNIGLLMIINSLLIRLFTPIYLGNKFLKLADFFHSTMLIPTSISIAEIARKHKKIHIGQSIGDDINIYLEKVYNYKIFRKFLSKIDKFQFNSKALMNDFLFYFPDYRSRSFVLYRSVDTKLFYPQKSFVNKYKKFLFLGGVQTYDIEKFDLLNTKGIHILIKAWELTKNYNLNSELIIGGPGVIKSKVINMFSKSEMLKNVRIIEDKINPNMMNNLLNSVDWVIIPSLHEGLPNLANEAQACGIPLIASDAGGIPETVFHNKNGFLFPKGDYKCLSQLIVKANEGQFELEFSIYGYKRVQSELSTEFFLSKIKKELNES